MWNYDTFMTQWLTDRFLLRHDVVFTAIDMYTARRLITGGAGENEGCQRVDNSGIGTFPVIYPSGPEEVRPPKRFK